MKETKIILTEKEMPTRWYNVQPDLPEPLPPLLHPGTNEPTRLPPPLFANALNDQEFSKERWIDIPEEIQNILRMWRPTNLHRAYRLEKALDTPAKIYYKYEGSSPAGSHKPNTAVAQAYYNKNEGIKRLTTETGAGQWGSALAMGCMFLGLECKVYMVKASYYQKPYRRIMMETWGAKVVPSPSTETEIGRRILAEDPN
ncbi:MAG: pyridoxal-phosphate dependent enzyme, partial [Chloroflexota bacterium]|nr:pyridoxal-phosphate dependent enzyme [Chloroflexota bacterium]